MKDKKIKTHLELADILKTSKHVIRRAIKKLKIVKPKDDYFENKDIFAIRSLLNSRNKKEKTKDFILPKIIYVVKETLILPSKMNYENK